MKNFTKRSLVSLSLLTVISTASAFDNPHKFTANDGVQNCYGFAMVGMDSVINSRLGVPAEHALELAKLTRVSSSGDSRYEMDLLANILNAYIWEGSPHSYAINVFYQCAQSQNPMRSASIEPIED